MFGKKNEVSEPASRYATPPDDYVRAAPKTIGKDWSDIDTQLAGRASLFDGAYTHLRSYVADATVRFRLAATDAFVEKAQYRLGTRARILARWGIVTAVGALGLLLTMAVIVHAVDITSALGAKPDSYVLTLYILRSVTVGGFVGGAAYLLAGLSKALFHEATVLVTRRHSLRFGRLCLYLHDGQLDAEALMKAFRWSDEFTSAFQQLKEEGIKGGPIRIVEQVPPTLEGVAKVVQAARGSGKTDGSHDKTD